VFIPFYVLFLIAQLITTAFGKIVESLFTIPKTPEIATAATEEILQWFSALIATLLVITALTFIVAFVVGNIISGTAIKYAADLLEKESASLQASFNFTILHLPSLIAAGIITGVLILLGLICLIVPGIIIAIMFALVTPVIMIEQMGALESLGRSRRLVSGRWGKTFATLLLLIIIVGILTLLATAISGFFGLGLKFKQKMQKKNPNKGN
jgi:hypothetical protein